MYKGEGIKIKTIQVNDDKRYSTGYVSVKGETEFFHPAVYKVRLVISEGDAISQESSKSVISRIYRQCTKWNWKVQRRSTKKTFYGWDLGQNSEDILFCV